MSVIIIININLTANKIERIEMIQTNNTFDLQLFYTRTRIDQVSNFKSYSSLRNLHVECRISMFELTT